MASPFTIFRKNQKILLAVFGVALMIVFTVGGVLTQFMGRGGIGSTDFPVVLTWKPANRELSVDENDISSMRLTRNLLRQLFAFAFSRAQAEDPNTPFQPKVRGVPNTDDEQSLIQTMVLAHLAVKNGIVVSDDAIFEYMRQYTDGILDAKGAEEALDENDKIVFKNMINEVAGEKITRQRLFEALRKEILAEKMRQLGTSGLSVIPPSEAWQYHQRVNRQISAELVAFPVEDFLAQVTQEPTDAEIQALYDEYKDQFSHPLSPEPGFKQRFKVDFTYVKGDYNKILEEEMAKIAPEVVQDYYEKNKDNKFLIPELPSTSETNSTEEATDDSTSATQETPVENQPPSEENQEDPTTDTKTQPVTPVNETLPETEIPDNSSSNENGASEDPNESTIEPDSPDSGQQSLNSSPDVAAFQEPEEPSTEEQTEKGNSPTTNETSKETKEENSEATVESQIENEKPTEEATTDESIAEETGTEKASDESTADEAPSPQDLEVESSPESENPVDSSPKYQPLEKVEEEIRRELASKDAQDRLKEAFRAIQSEIDAYRGKYTLWKVGAESNPSESQPIPPDITKLATEHGLEAIKTGLVDAIEIYDGFDLGKSFRMVRNEMSSQGFQNIPFFQVAYVEGKPMFKPERTLGTEQEEFLYWKTDETAEKTLELAEAREQVVLAWKLEKAKELAENFAEEQSIQVRTSGLTLKENYGDTKTVIESQNLTFYDQISLMMFRFQGQLPRVSEIEGIEDPGEDFMKALFDLGVDEFGVISNQAKSIYYVAHVISQTTPEESDREKFLDSLIQDPVREGLTQEITTIAILERQLIFREWYSELETQLEIQWKRDPLFASDQ